MKINIPKVFELKKSYIIPLTPEKLDKIRFSKIANQVAYKKALDFIETERTEKDKELAYKLIEQAIEQMENEKTPLLVNNLFFAIAYPESYSLIDKYYVTLTTTCLENKKFMGFDGTKMSPFNKTGGKSRVIEKIKQIKQSTYALFISHFGNAEFLKTDGGFDSRAIDNILYAYRILKIGTNDNPRTQQLAKEIYYLIVESNYTLEEVCKKYKLGQPTIHSILRDNFNTEEYETIKKILNRNSQRRYYEMQKTIKSLYYYIPNGITLENGTKKKFTMLDYYSLTHFKPDTIIVEMISQKPNTKEEYTTRAKCIKYLEKHKNLGQFINKKMLLSKRIIISIDGIEYKIEDYADDIISAFNENGIPCYSFLLETAFYRLAKNEPLFPLREGVSTSIKL